MNRIYRQSAWVNKCVGVLPANYSFLQSIIETLREWYTEKYSFIHLINDATVWVFSRDY